MIYIEAPNYQVTPAKKSVFLAGGITNCPDWQAEMVSQLKDQDIVIFNPRRANFPIDDPNAAHEQIKWEHDMLREADIIIFWFCHETMCPIVLYELGAHSMTEKPIIIGIDKDYSRKQDIEIQTQLVRPDIKIVYSLNDVISELKKITDDIDLTELWTNE